MPSWQDDPLELAIREFCYGGGRAIPRSVFMSWSEADKAAALEWLVYEQTRCPGCGRPRTESFDIAMDDHYHVVPIVCHGCAAQQRKARLFAQDGEVPGVYFIVRPEVPDGQLQFDGGVVAGDGGARPGPDGGVEAP